MKILPRIFYKHFIYSGFIVVGLVLALSSCTTKPKSDIDTPEYHYKAGMRQVEMRQYSDAKMSFQRSTDLDKKFTPGYCGMALADAHLGNKKEAKKLVNKAEGMAERNPDLLTLCARVWITLRNQDKRWHKSAERLLKKALKREKKHEGALYYTGEMQLYKHEFSHAQDYFRQVVEMRGEFSGRADDKWQLSQKIVRAMPGTSQGKKVALYEKITRADLAALFSEELKISELMKRQSKTGGGFQTPAEMATAGTDAGNPSDSRGHWAEVWINEISRYGILEAGPGQPFYPDEPVNRAEYAMAVQRLLVLVSGDSDLETRYFGETPSRFSDVSSSHPAYSAMAVCTERGIMQANVVTGRFDAVGPVSGADALISIRTFQNALRLTF